MNKDRKVFLSCRNLAIVKGYRIKVKEGVFTVKQSPLESQVKAIGVTVPIHKLKPSLVMRTKVKYYPVTVRHISFWRCPLTQDIS